MFVIDARYVNADRPDRPGRVNWFAIWYSRDGARSAEYLALCEGLEASALGRGEPREREYRMRCLTGAAAARANVYAVD